MPRPVIRPRYPRRPAIHGRGTGKAYAVKIWFVVEGASACLVTANMQHQWPRNLQVHPTVHLRIGDETFSGTITRITGPEEMARVARLLGKKKYWLARAYLWFKGQPDGAFRVALNP